MRSYRAAQLAGPGQVSMVTEVFLPLQPAEVRVRVTQCGVCSSNLPVWQGRDWFTYPFPPGAPGHEAIGLIEEVGAEVDELQLGDRVAYFGTHGFAEFETVAKAHVMKLPAHGPSDFVGEPMACAINIIRRAGLRRGDTVALVGLGFLGRLLVPLIQAEGVKLIAITRHEGGRRFAGQYGVEAPYAEGIRAWAETVKEINGGRLCDVVVEAAGDQWALDLAAELTRERGRLIIAGYHQDGLRQINLQLWNWRGLDVVNAHERDPAVYLEGLRLAWDAAVTGMWNLPSLISHRFMLTELNLALSAAERREPDFSKAVIVL